MEDYANLSGRSGVFRYDIGDTYIIVVFDKGETYTYDYGTYGQDKVDQMKQLAIAGLGLNTFINYNFK